MARPRRPGRRDRRHGDWRPAALGHRRRRLRRADRSRREGDRLRDRGSPPGERRRHGPDQHGRRPAGPRGPRASAGPPDRQRGARERDAGAAAALGGGLPGAIRHSRGAPRPDHRTDRQAPRRPRGCRGRRQEPCGRRPGKRHARRRGGAPARVSPRGGRSHRPGDGRRLQARRPRPPPRGLGRLRDAPRAARGMAARDRGHPTAHAIGRPAGPDRRLRAGRGCRPLDPARGHHGRRGSDRGSRRAAPVAVVRASPRGHAHPRAQSAIRRRPKLAAQLRRGHGHPGVRGPGSGT